MKFIQDKIYIFKFKCGLYGEIRKEEVILLKYITRAVMFYILYPMFLRLVFYLSLLIDVLKPLPIQLPSTRCLCVGSCERCESFRACTSFPHSHSSLPEVITPATYTGIMESLGTLYRPTPLRPVARGKLQIVLNAITELISFLSFLYVLNDNS